LRSREGGLIIPLLREGHSEYVGEYSAKALLGSVRSEFLTQLSHSLALSKPIVSREQYPIKAKNWENAKGKEIGLERTDEKGVLLKKTNGEKLGHGFWKVQIIRHFQTGKALLRPNVQKKGHGGKGGGGGGHFISWSQKKKVDSRIVKKKGGFFPGPGPTQELQTGNGVWLKPVHNKKLGRNC